jgi:hypothetical protein
MREREKKENEKKKVGQLVISSFHMALVDFDWSALSELEFAWQ